MSTDHGELRGLSYLDKASLDLADDFPMVAEVAAAMAEAIRFGDDEDDILEAISAATRGKLT